MTLRRVALAVGLALAAAMGVSHPEAFAAKKRATTGGAKHGGAGRAGARAAKRSAERAETPQVVERTATTNAASTTTSAEARAEAAGAGGGEVATTTGGKPAKTKVYTFGAMDVEGKLKTPQLLYFLNRVKLELEMSAPDRRSFMKELEKSADDSNL